MTFLVLYSGLLFHKCHVLSSIIFCKKIILYYYNSSKCSLDKFPDILKWKIVENWNYIHHYPLLRLVLLQTWIFSSGKQPIHMPIRLMLKPETVWLLSDKSFERRKLIFSASFYFSVDVFHPSLAWPALNHRKPITHQQINIWLLLIVNATTFPLNTGAKSIIVTILLDTRNIIANLVISSVHGETLFVKF